MRFTQPLQAVEPLAASAELAPMSVAPTAAMLVFDAAPVYSNMQGSISLTLSARQFVPDNRGGVHEQDLVVGFLRCSAAAAQSLRQAIDAALLLGQPAAGGASN